MRDILRLAVTILVSFMVGYGSSAMRQPEIIIPDISEALIDRSIERMRTALIELQEAEAQQVMSRNGIRWTEEEFPWISVYCEIHDVPMELGIIMRKMENGYLAKMGQIKVQQAIRSTTKPTHHQFHQAARTLRRAAWWLLLDNPDIYRILRKKAGLRAEPEDLIRIFPTAYTAFMIDEVWKPEKNREEYKKFILDNLKTGDWRE